MPSRISDRSPEQIEVETNCQALARSGLGFFRYTRYEFFQITDIGSFKRDLETLATRVLTARDYGSSRRVHGVPWDEVQQFAFSYQGFHCIGLPERLLSQFPPEFSELPIPPANSTFPSETIHLLRCTYSVNGPGLAPPPPAGTKLLFELDGSLRCHRCEPFGFRDGLTEPRIHGWDGNSDVHAGELFLGAKSASGQVSESILVPMDLDPGNVLPEAIYSPCNKDLGRWGTFLVFQDLEQDVSGFWKGLHTALVQAVGPASLEKLVWAASRMIGRWPSGWPVSLAPDADPGGEPPDEEFSFSSDPNGVRCPFSAHIRRTNPRDVVPNRDVELSRLESARRVIFRRSRVYGSDAFDPRILLPPYKIGLDSFFGQLSAVQGTRGLRFVALNASIRNQFGFVVSAWVNNPSFGGAIESPDPIIGYRSSEGQSLFRILGREGDIEFNLPRCAVSIRCSGSFLLPSIPALRWLASGASTASQ